MSLAWSSSPIIGRWTAGLVVEHDFRIVDEASWRNEKFYEILVVEQVLKSWQLKELRFGPYLMGTCSSFCPKVVQEVEKLAFALEQVPVEINLPEHR